MVEVSSRMLKLKPTQSKLCYKINWLIYWYTI